MPDALLGLHRRIGYSTHNAMQLPRGRRRAGWTTWQSGRSSVPASKENPDPVVGLDALRSLRALTRKPLVAIGGITRDNVHAVYEAGADSIAVIGAL